MAEQHFTAIDLRSLAILGLRSFLFRRALLLFGVRHSLYPQKGTPWQLHTRFLVKFCWFWRFQLSFLAISVHRTHIDSYLKGMFQLASPNTCENYINTIHSGCVVQTSLPRWQVFVSFRQGEHQLSYPACVGGAKPPTSHAEMDTAPVDSDAGIPPCNQVLGLRLVCIAYLRMNPFMVLG